VAWNRRHAGENTDPVSET